MEHDSGLPQPTATLFAGVNAALGLPGKAPRLLSPLVLAYIGDTVYDLYVRTQLVLSSDAGVHGLHVQSAGRVCAAAQAKALRAVERMLLEDELYIYRRGRNSHMGTVPKHASIADYRTATGFEALLGYLYLSGQDARLSAILRAALTPDLKEETDHA
ncbi:MAG: Mini-ribonuclease 3 [Christensenellaceae bacterium]|jgi:ribonuclease-3 family protein|nr:Mini-ribonuclease 3 [Christensenellaceae bacterium]